ncbi:TRAM domain-containing protein [Candidatus Micrarchaeota archaeon]|nr:TRAM domain-containing protein [Candidatus Micrarchaeota archaeon]
MWFRPEGDFAGGRRNFRPSFGGGFREPPVKVGEEYDLEIQDTAKKGDGIGRVEGFIVFVAGAKKGEKVRVRIAEVKNRFAVGEVLGEGQPQSDAPEEKSEEAPEDEPAEESEESKE